MMRGTAAVLRSAITFHEVRMRKLAMCVTTAVLVLVASDARAQWTPLEGRLLVSINGGGQLGGGDIEQLSVFELSGEEAQVQTRQDLGGGGLFDIGGAYRVGKNWGVGIAINKTGDRGDATVEGSLPNPLFFDRPRAFTTTVAALKHDETAVHLQGAWFMPFTDKVDFVFTGGPTIFNASQEFAGAVSFTNTGSEFEGVVIDSVAVSRVKDSGLGFNIGADAIYNNIYKTVGAGLLLRYTYGSIGFDLGNGQTSDIKVGGFQIAVGARVRF
jgi:hypothetical protein